MRTATKLALITLASAGLVFVETAAMSLWGVIGKGEPIFASRWLGEVDPSWPAAPSRGERGDSTWIGFIREEGSMGGAWVGSGLHGALYDFDIGPGSDTAATFVRVGWPARCMRFDHLALTSWTSATAKRVTVTNAQISVWRAGLEPPSWLPERSEQVHWAGASRRIPLMPIWSGYAVNTAVNAVLLWGVLFLGNLSWRQLTSWRRRRRGLCAKCAYSRTGLPPGSACPECGQID